MTRPRFFAPEVVQSSAMDCGPAALSALLEGFGVRVDYGRLREACQTDVDGTSIDRLEDVALGLGLEVEQVVIPPDHVLREEAAALPALTAIKLPSGGTHFIVLWRSVGPWVQVMDPSSGRVWLRRESLLSQLYLHGMIAPAADWRAWAASDEFIGVLRARLRELGCRPSFVDDQVGAALDDPSWDSLARLDAAARMLDDMVKVGALRPGAEVQRAMVTLIRESRDEERWIPERCRSARALPPEAQDDGAPDGENVLVYGAVLLRVLGVRDRRSAAAGALVDADDPADAVDPTSAPPLPPSLASALDESAPTPGRQLLGMLAADGWLRPSAVIVALIAASLGVLVEAALLRGLVELSARLSLVGERLIAWIALVAFALVLVLLEATIVHELRRSGRRLELRLRTAFLTKVPRLGARYFQSRLSSDMAERIHAMHSLRGLPALGGQIVRTTAALLLTVAGVAWLDPSAAIIAGAAALLLIATAALALPILRERDLRLRSHGGALSRVYLDALLGLWPVRAHGAARALRREHEQLLVEWVRAGLDLLRASIGVELLQGLLGTAAVITVVARHSLEVGEVGATLLLIFWAMQIPALGQKVGGLLRQYPAHRSRALRLLEPLGAPDEEELGSPADDREHDGDDDRDDGHGALKALPPGGLDLRFDGVHIVAGGHVLLRELNLEIRAGEHVAIVGASGAGKSTLVGALLGWHRPAHGRVLVGGAPLEGARLAELRRRTAWVDPSVALWDEPLLDNLLYGSTGAAIDGIGEALEDATLLDLVANLPDGLQTQLGEGGTLLSGGEGQRVRLGRALLRADVDLVVLDEALRGLDHGRRRALLGRLRSRWSAATLLCVTHDIEETLEFPRVIVVADGAVVEDGDPRELSQRPGFYWRMLAKEREVRASMWGRPEWRQIYIDDGQLTEGATASPGSKEVA